ncbi:MAG: FtsX-like permease family protein, partial [Candidatus Thorarchaeota archaeon]|nr:FtsX-like permease family protein [Candidatus Thorarchaeota archaeon]
MAGTLLRKTRKEILSQRGKVFSSMLLVFIAVLSLVMFTSMMPMMRATIDNTYDIYAAPDMMAVAYSVPRDHITEIGSIAGVEAFTSRYHVFGGITYSDNEENSADLYGLDPTSPPDVFKLLLDQGNYLNPTDNSSALIEKSFAEAHEIELGSSFTMSVFGEQFELKIVGIVISLEHLFPHRNPKQLIYGPSRASFVSVAPIWLDIAVLQELSYTGVGEKDVINEILVKFDEGVDSSTVSEMVLDAISPYPIVSTLETADLRSAELQRFDIADDFIVLFAGIIFAVASFVIYSTVKRIVESNSRNIGITKSLGYTTSEIQKSYHLVLSGFAIIATLLALPLAEPGGRAILQSFATQYSMEIQLGVADPSIFLIALIAGPLAVLLSAYFPIRKIAGYEPIRAIRGGMMEKGFVGETLLERIGKKIGIQGYGVKFVVRGMSLNKARVGFMIIGIALAASVASVGSIMVTGFNQSINVYMEQNEHWDMLVDFKQPMNSAQVDSLIAQVSDIVSYEPYLKLGANAFISGESRIISLLALNPSGRLHEFNLESGRNIENTHEVLVDVSVSEILGVGQDDAINITIGDTSALFDIVGVVSSPMNVFYISMNEISEILGTEMTSGLFVETNQGVDTNVVADSVFSLDEVEDVMTISEATSGVLSEEQGTLVAMGMAAMAMILLIAVIWNIVSISVGEKIPELAQLEAIGWSRNSLTRLLFIELTIVSTFGIVLSIPVGQVMSSLFDGFMKSFIPFYIASFDIIGFLVVATITVITTLIASIPSVIKLRRIVVDRVIRDRM